MRGPADVAGPRFLVLRDEVTPAHQGRGNTTGLRLPSVPTARTPKKIRSRSTCSKETAGAFEEAFKGLCLERVFE
jgi:hypothetical protein